MRMGVRLLVRGGEGMMVGIVYCFLEECGSKRVVILKSIKSWGYFFFLLEKILKYLWIVMIELLKINVYFEELRNNYKV